MLASRGPCAILHEAGVTGRLSHTREKSWFWIPRCHQRLVWAAQTYTKKPKTTLSPYCLRKSTQATDTRLPREIFQVNKQHTSAAETRTKVLSILTPDHRHYDVWICEHLWCGKLYNLPPVLDRSKDDVPI
jgi:hypothetical protein